MKNIARKIWIVTLLILLASPAIAGISGSAEAEYTTHSVSDPSSNTDETAAALSQKYSLYYSKTGSFGRSLAYAGFLGGELYGIKNWLPEEEEKSVLISGATQGQSGIGGLLGKDWKSRMITGGAVEFNSPWRWLPMYLYGTSTDDSLPYVEKSSLNTTFGSSPIIPVDQTTGVTLPERSYQTLTLNLGYRNSIAFGKNRNMMGLRNPNVVQAEIEDREAELESSSRKRMPMWDSLPYIYLSYNANSMKTERNYTKQDDAQSNLSASIGKDKIWLNYHQITYDNNLYKDVSWTEKRYELGTISERGYRDSIVFDKYSLRISPNIYYAKRDGANGYTSYGANLSTAGKLYYPTFFGWRDGEVKTFLSYDNQVDVDGAKTVQYQLPIYFLYGGETLDERIRYEKKSDESTSKDGATTTINKTDSFSWSADINKTGEFLFHPALNLSTTKSSSSSTSISSKEAQNDSANSLNLQSSLYLSTTSKFSTRYSYTFGGEVLYQNLPADFLHYKLSGRIYYRLDSHSSLYFDQTVGYYDYDKKWFEGRDRQYGTFNIWDAASTMGYSFTPNSKYSLSLTGTALFLNAFDIGQMVAPQVTNQEKYYVNLGNSYRTGNLTIDLSNRLTSESATPLVKTGTVTFESRNVASYMPIRSTEIAGEIEYRYTKNEGEVKQLIGRQRASYRYISQSQKELWNLQQRAELTKEITKCSGAESEFLTKTVGLNLNITPGTKVSLNGRINYTDSTSNKTLSYGAGTNINFKSLQMAFDWQAGRNDAGREEQKWTASIKKFF